MSDESRQNLLANAAEISADTDLEAQQPVPSSLGSTNTNSNIKNTNAVKEYFDQSSHPIAAFFFLAFRLGALLMYLLGSIFTDNFTLVFVITILLLAFDFWTVKNVSGRLLVGLRWWNEIQEDGSNKWSFESLPNRPTNAADSRLFWTVLYGTPVLWILFALSCIFTFKFTWLVIVVVAIVLNMANVVGYTQCDKDAKRKWASNMTAQAAFGSLTGSAGLVGKAVSSGLGKFFSR
ncbi:DUF846-domain-containing protein [Hesseltinella vesiculosa]|uniref:Golgi apparatus membrane protein TVP23 n=1 Tax=Hesseltinella vesiculosa TaxID=101127 RepID=A0A1X2GXC5_9FUNG|nr:DUF846-domain-containing protein [Hesseltinella vesiculosa]